MIAREFADLDGIERVEILGSWAARYHGEPGPPPGDIDVLVVGSSDPDDVYDASIRVERALGREVNAVMVTSDRWKEGEDAFLRQIRCPFRPNLADGPATDLRSAR